MHLLFLFISSFLLVIMISSIFVYLFNKKIGLFLPLSFMILGLTYYLIGLIFGSFSLGKYILILYLIIGTYSFIKCIMNKRKNKIFTTGVLFLLIAYIFAFVYCYKYSFCQSDEFVHWGPMVRSMFMYDKYYSACGVMGGAHPEYPPFLSLLELIFCILYGSYSESVISICLHIVGLVFFIVPYIDVFKLKFKKSLLLLLVLILLIVSFDKFGIVRTIYVDFPLAIISSFPLILIFSDVIESCFGKLYFGISLGCILLNKPSGYILFFFDLAIYFIVFIRRKKIKNVIIDILLYVLISFIIFIPWLLYIYMFNSSVGINGQFSAIRLFNKIIHFHVNDREIKIIKTILFYVLSENAFNSSIRINYYVLYLIIIFAFVIISYINKVDNRCIIFFVIASIVMFYVSLCCIYCFAMEDYELINLRSLPRYIGSFNIYLLIVFLLFNREYIDNVYLNAFIISILIVVNITNYKKIIPRVCLNERIHQESTNGEKYVANYINTYIKRDSKILVVCDSISVARLEYLTMYKTKMSSSSVYSNAYYNNSIISVNKLVDEMIGYDYVLFNIENRDDFDFINESIQRNTNCNAIYNYFLYEVREDDEDLLFLMT